MEVHQGAQFSLSTACYSLPLEQKIAVLVPLVLLLLMVRWFVSAGNARWEFSVGIVLLPLLVALSATAFSLMWLIALMEEPRRFAWSIYSGAVAETLATCAIGGWCSILGAAAGIIGSMRGSRVKPPRASESSTMVRRLFELILVALVGLVTLYLAIALRIGYAPADVDAAWGLPARGLFYASLLATLGLGVLLVLARRHRLGEERSAPRSCFAFAVVGVAIGIVVLGLHLLSADLMRLARPDVSRTSETRPLPSHRFEEPAAHFSQ